MIGNVKTGASFYGCLLYCLHDKKELSEEKKRELSEQDHLQHKDRAEVLYYNKCFGNAGELARDFIDVSKLSKRVEKPVFHFSLRLAEGDRLSKAKWVEVGEALAKEFGVADNQYVCILHKDTNEQHIHLVANRVGFDGKVASDSNSYKRIANLCRKLEVDFQLQVVKNPRRFQSKEERQLPRNDKRKERLSNDIREVLKEVISYRDFEAGMKRRGYGIVKGRGIAFIDEQKVKTKGSEVGFSLAKIEKILSAKQELAQKKAAQKNTSYRDNQNITAVSREDRARQVHASLFLNKETKALEAFIENLLKPEYVDNYVDYEFTQQAYERRRKKERYRQHH